MAAKTLTLESPQPAQQPFFDARERFVCYGGARGGGKSWCVRQKSILMAARWAGIRILIMRRTLVELRENHIRILRAQLNGVADYKATDKAFEFPNGSLIAFGYCDSESDMDQYQGQEYDVIFMDEATHFTEYQYSTLTACLRGVNDFPKRMYLTCNPGGVGHAWVKRLFIDRQFKKGERPEDYVFFKALVTDNQILMEKDPEYVRRLDNLPSGLREAWRDGKSSLPGAREWVESGFDSFSAKETAVYQGMNDAGVSDRDAVALLRELGAVQKTDEESANAIKRRLILNSGITGDGKSVAYYGLLANDKERALMDELSDVADMGTATEMLARLKDSPKSREKYQTVLDADLPELAKRMTYRSVFGEDDEKTLNKLSTQGVGIDDWLSYRAQTADLTADKDSNGKTVSGSLKAKEMAVIDALPLTTSAKDALYLATGHTESTLEDAPWHTVSSLALPRVGGYAAPNLTLPQLSLPALKLPRS